MSFKTETLNQTRTKQQLAPNPCRPARLKSVDVISETLDRPFVFVNMAMTADGKIASAHRNISSFGSEQDQKHLLELRATADAVMSGVRTVNYGKINMGTGGVAFQKQRLSRGLARHNLRIIVSGSGSINPDAEVFKHDFSPIIILTTQRIPTATHHRLNTLADVKISGKTAINFHDALRWLKRSWGVNRLLCEGGGELNDALFRAGLIDELHLTVCPKIFGGRKSPTIADGLGFNNLALATRLELTSMKRIGDELFLVYSRPKPSLTNKRQASKH